MLINIRFPNNLTGIIAVVNLKGAFVLLKSNRSLMSSVKSVSLPFFPFILLISSFSTWHIFYITKQANVIPSSARVTVNHRVHPSNTLEEVRSSIFLWSELPALFKLRCITQPTSISLIQSKYRESFSGLDLPPAHPNLTSHPWTGDFEKVASARRKI